MIFKSLSIEDWNQFEKVDIQFNSKLTVITGANGAGKSTILRLLGKFIGWEYSEMATPINSEKLKALDTDLEENSKHQIIKI